MILKKLYSCFIVCENRYEFITINSQKVIMLDYSLAVFEYREKCILETAFILK